jgi:TPR repeat protein
MVAKSVYVAMTKTKLIALVILGLAALRLQADTTLEELRSGAEQGDAESQFTLALRYDHGTKNVQKDPALAATWYRRAAEQGHAEAQNSLGSMLQADDGIAQDYVEAVRWYQAAADNGIAEANNNLGYMHDLGLGVPEDDVEAVKLYRKSAEAGHTEAMLNIGVMYAYGTGVEKDLETAYMWADLGRFYTQQSDDKSLKWRVRNFQDYLSKDMTKQQIKHAKARAKEWDELHRYAQ